MSSIPKWDDERTETLKSVVGTTSPVSVEKVKAAAEKLETNEKSIAAKLRNMGYKVDSLAIVKGKNYTEAEEAEIKSFLEANPNKYTYEEIAAAVLNGSRTAKQIQGKILSMDLYGMVKPTPKPEVVHKYTEAEEAKLLKLLSKGGFIEDIAEAMGREVNSIRGKILSLSRTNTDIKIPKQRTYKSKDVEDPIEALGDISDMTVEEISVATGKSERGVKTMLTRRGLSCKNYNGARRAEKNAEKAAAAAG
jgi:transcription initiation factor IIE alpha subunit